MIPQELKDLIVAAAKAEKDAAETTAIGNAVSAGFDAGVQSVGSAGGSEPTFTQTQVNEMLAQAVSDFASQAVSAAHDAIDAHDANTQVDSDLKTMVQTAIHALHS